MNNEQTKKEYYDFIDQYNSKHESCPSCGAKEYTSTLLGFPIDLSSKDTYRDLNDCVCVYCGHKHTKHERV